MCILKSIGNNKIFNSVGYAVIENNKESRSFFTQKIYLTTPIDAVAVFSRV